MVRKPQRGRLSSVPSGHPLRFFGERKVFLWGKLLTWRIRQVGSKKSPRFGGGFFSVLVSWRLWDEVRFETLMDWILIFVRCLITWIFLECGSPSLPAIRFW